MTRRLLHLFSSKVPKFSERSKTGGNLYVKRAVPRDGVANLELVPQSVVNSYRQISDAKETRNRFVLILPWLGAPASALKKYEELYTRRGFKPIVYQASLKDFLLPKSGLKTSVRVLENLKEKIPKNGQEARFVIHSSSVGCYFYALMLWQMRQNPDAFGVVKEAIVAQVCDSPVVGSLNEMAYGIGHMLSPKSEFLAALCRKICLSYFAASKKTVTLYEELIVTFKHHAPLVPSMICSSENDPMRMPKSYEDLYDAWRKRSLVLEKLWKESLHAQHLRYHPSEYASMVEKLLFHAEKFQSKTSKI